MASYKFVRTPDPIYVDTLADAEDWHERYYEQDAVGFDTETTGLHSINARVKFFSFSDGDSRICAPVRLLETFAPVLEHPRIEKRMSNAKFDMHMVANHGILLKGEVPDTVVQDWLLDENRKGRHGLKDCSKDYLGLRMSPFKSVFGNVGSVEKEVRMVTHFHDILEAGDSDAAAEALITVGKADGEESVLSALKKLSLSKQGGYSLTARKLLGLARPLQLATKSTGQWSYVSDFLFMLWGAILPKKADRAPYVHLLEDMSLIEEAHEWMIRELRKRIEIDLEPLEMLRLLVCDYASLDAWGSFTLVDVFRALLDDEHIDDSGDQAYTLQDHYLDVQQPYTRVLWNMERRGIPYDTEGSEQYAKPMGKQIGRLERSMVAEAGFDINPRSPDQMRALLYSKDSNGDWIDPFGEAPRFWSKGGKTGVKTPSTNKEAIAHWAEKGHTFSATLQEHRKLTKLYDTYLTSVPEWVDHRSRIHTNLKQHGTVTWRLASGDPNLQNIPARPPWGPKLRKLFVAGQWGDCSPNWCMEPLRDVPVPDLPPDFPMKLIVADYEQLEMRIMAHFSEDETMIDAIWRGLDLHCRTAELAGGLDYDELVAAKKADTPTPEQVALVAQRTGFKAVGFGLLYGIGPVKLGRQLGLQVTSKMGRNGRTYENCPDAQQLIKDYFGVYPKAKRFINGTKARCKEDLFVQTISGRFRRLPDILSTLKGISAMAERQSVNSIIQGSAADITGQAMLKCEHDEELRMLGVRMLLQIHDELVFEVPDIPELVEAAEERIKTLMEDPFEMLVPIAISMSTAYTWGEAK